MENDFSTDKGTYTPTDFAVWQNNDMLEITPKFQRRKVWRTSERSFFIDTMLRGMTVPPLYFRLVQNKDRTKTVRQVIDGQQRVSTVLDFMTDEFKLSTGLGESWAGKSFSQLTRSEKDKIKLFGFSIETFKGISDPQVFELFSRLNMHGVPLNKQELRNGKFFGLFKKTCYGLAFANLEFWRLHKMFSELKFARMLEVELTSELLIAGMKGMQDKKSSIDHWYKELDKKYPGKDTDQKNFKETMEAISETFPSDELAGSVFKRPPLFYALYCVVFHHVFGLPNVERHSPKKRLSADGRSSLKDAVLYLSEVLEEAEDKTKEEMPKKYIAFVTATQRQTDNIGPRKDMFNALYEEAF